jgi:DNA-binding XRE family transcriptional regulator
VKELVSLLEQAQDEEERVEITKTLLEVLFPKSIGGVGALEDEGELTARARVDAYRKQVGQAIRQQREAIGMTQEQLAELAGIPQSHVSRLERGKHAPSHLTIQRVAAALKTKPSQLDPGFDDEEL